MPVPIKTENDGLVARYIFITTVVLGDLVEVEFHCFSLKLLSLQLILVLFGGFLTSIHSAYFQIVNFRF